MSESFKINIYFDENSEELEKIISDFLIRKLDKTPCFIKHRREEKCLNK